MELTEKVIIALQEPLHAEYLRVNDEDGISGFVVSSRFEKLSSLDRQKLIDKALRNAADPLSKDERRQVLMIAGLTPLEYEAVGTQIRVDTINELSDGSLEVVLQGCLSDATYVRGTLRNQKDIEADEPKQSQRANRAIMTFRVWGTDTNPLTKEKAMSVLRTDPYIEVIQKA